MKWLLKLVLGLVLLIGFSPQAEVVINIQIATIQNGQVHIEGDQAPRRAAIFWEGVGLGISTNNGGAFTFNTTNLPTDCVGRLNIGAEQRDVLINNCTPVSEAGLLATGQTTAYQADKNDGITGEVAVPDDGTLQLGVTLNYQDNGDGTVTDLNTGLMWEKKVAGSGCLHCVLDAYRWSGDGSQETIWDWLDDLNATNFAGHSDWRIPNVRELESIKNYQATLFAISPVFGPTQVIYWSSTTFVQTTSLAWRVGFALNQGVNTDSKTTISHGVRAVRGGL